MYRSPQKNELYILNDFNAICITLYFHSIRILSDPSRIPRLPGQTVKFVHDRKECTH